MTLARTTIVPRPSPGKISALFDCPITYVTPLYVTGSNGLPVATNALPSVHSIKSLVLLQQVALDSTLVK